jgi:hypothetical protein
MSDNKNSDLSVALKWTTLVVGGTICLALMVWRMTYLPPNPLDCDGIVWVASETVWKSPGHAKPHHNVEYGLRPDGMMVWRVGLEERAAVEGKKGSGALAGQ